MSKRQDILQYIIDNDGADIEELMEKFESSSVLIRQNISYLRKQGNLIKTMKRDGKCFYLVTLKAEKKDSICSKIRTVLETGDEWETEEIASICGATRFQVANMIGAMRRTGLINTKTIKLGHNRYSYQMI